MNRDVTLKIEKVLERDIDLLMINKLLVDKNILDLFLKKIGKPDYKIASIQHSLTDQEDGESDITVILEKGNSRIGLLIEDKIDAIAMPNQRNRYNIRGNKGIENQQYSEYFVFMIAPADYLKENAEAKLYENQIAYEELKEALSNDIFASTLIEKALEEKKNGYVAIENEMVTEFWKKYYEFIRNNYPKIKIHEINGPRGSRAAWPEMITDRQQVVIIHKSDRGYMDLTFNKMANHVSVFNKYTENKIPKGYNIVKTGKSLSIRLEVPVIDFKSDFDNYIDEMHECMGCAMKLYELLKNINTLMMYEEVNNSKKEE